jgi:hypothetical protein
MHAFTAKHIYISDLKILYINQKHWRQQRKALERLHAYMICISSYVRACNNGSKDKTKRKKDNGEKIKPGAFSLDMIRKQTQRVMRSTVRLFV